MRRESPIQFVLRLLVAAYLVEAGLVLTIFPWTSFWDANYFAYVVPWLGQWMANPYVRGGVTGVGLVTGFAGLRDLSSAILARSAASDSPPPVP
jgi:hypothetical protein